ncbi:MAG: hypothetical protein GX595_08820 [Lentisphaerae bacterium]|nr:hypothetical protein [Lentisphaerota bacterium]
MMTVPWRRVLLGAVCLAFTAWCQDSDWLDDFSGPELHPRWTRDVSPKGSLALDSQRQVVVLGGDENVYNHLECDLPEGVTQVQADINNLSDPSASWSPSLILYWGPTAYVRVMISLHYGLRIEPSPGEFITLAERLRPVPDTWYRVRLVLDETSVRLVLAPVGEEPAEVVALARLPEWRGPCRLILGKGYMPRSAAQPDFDNDHGRGNRTIAAHLDNVVVGSPADLEARLAASVDAARLTGEQDPALLGMAFWPNVLSETTRDTLWFAEGAWQRVCLIYENRDPVHSAKQLRVDVEASEHLMPEDLVAEDLPLPVRTTRSGGMVRFTIDFPETFVIPADFHGVDRPKGDQPGWYGWPRSRRTPALFLHCRPSHQEPGRLRARLTRDGKPGPWTQIRAMVLPPLPAPPTADPRHLGLSLWEGTSLHMDGPRGDVLLDRILRQYQQVGLKRLHLHTASAVYAPARTLGIHTNLSSWWPYSSHCPGEVVPTAEEQATDPSRYATFCPEIIAAAAGTYGRFLETLTQRLKDTGADGFMLDYECAPARCFCERCREAFVQRTGHADVDWPKDVQRDGRYYRPWIDFRCEQGARYVKVIGEAARRARPECVLQAWVAGYNYNNTIESAQIDISKAAAYLTEPEVPHYTLPDTYAKMWSRDGGIFTIEAGLDTVRDSLAVVTRPLVFCSTVIYPLGASTPWSDPQLLHAQMLAMIGQGTRGISFWGGHDDGSVDGRFLHRLAAWNAILAAAGPYLWDGRRQDDALAISGADGQEVRATVWTLGEKTLAIVVNLTQDERQVTLPAVAGRVACDLIGRQALDLSQALAVPALDGRLVEIGPAAAAP